MKFQGKMTEIFTIRQFTQIVGLVARLAKLCVVRITHDRLFFIISESSSFGGSPHLWTELEQGHYFSKFNLEGVSQEHNEIFLELQPDKLAKILNSLKSSQSAKSLKIKLTKKHTPCLTFEVELPSLSSTNCRLVIHDIPVSPIPRRLWHLYQEPQMPAFQVSLYLPPLKQIRNIIDRMKNLSTYVSLSGNKKGSFIISVSTDSVKVSSHFKNLAMPSWDEQSNSNCNDSNTNYSATVDIRRLALFLQSDQVHPTKVICNIVNGQAIHLFLLHEDVTLQYFLPNVMVG